MWWPFRKKGEDIEKIEKKIKTSFSSVKKNHDFLKQDHHAKILDIFERLEKLEKHVWQSKDVTDKEATELQISNITMKHFENLTEKQKEFCLILAALHSESPNEWVSFKTLAGELYPNQDYNKVRSTISEYTSLLEELGFVKKRKKGGKAYVLTTQINPYIKKQPIIKVQKVKKPKSKKS